MTISDKGLALTKSFEGLRLHSYQDSAGVWTIGYGSTSNVKPGMMITQQQADDRLRVDMAQAQHAVDLGIRVPLNQNQYDALVDFAFNVGVGNFLRSALRTKLNNKQYDAVPEELMLWVKAGGIESVGLIRRRQAEATLFKEPIT